MALEKQKINWLQLLGIVIAVLIPVLSAMFWVNGQIVDLKADMRNMQKADYKADIKELKIDFDKKLNEFKTEQRDRDKSQWEAIGRKKDKP